MCSPIQPIRFMQPKFYGERSGHTTRTHGPVLSQQPSLGGLSLRWSPVEVRASRPVLLRKEIET